MASCQLSRAQQQHLRWRSSSSTSSCVASCSSGRAALLPQKRAALCAPAKRSSSGAACSGRSTTVVVRAESNRDGLARTVDTMLKRYDFVSTGMGALCVTGWFWSHGQPPLEALSIAAVSTIVALVVNELVFNNK